MPFRPESFRNIEVAMRNADEIPDDAEAHVEWLEISARV